MTTMFWIWLAAAIVFLIIELVAPALVFICFVAGGICAAFYGQFYPDAYLAQIGIFLAVSLVLLPFTRKFASRITKPSPQVSNVDRMIGQVAIVTEAIHPDVEGKVRFEGETWTATATTPITAHSKVKILSVSGTKLRVEPYEPAS